MSTKANAIPENAGFATGLYGQLAPAKGNLFFSPFGIYSALGALNAGAKGESRGQLSKILGVDAKDAYPEGLAAYGAQLASKQYTLSIANGLFLNQTMSFEPGFTGSAKKLQAETKELDFGKSEQATATVNQWIAKKTKDKIKDILKPGILNASIPFVITNAIYFHGEWSNEFDASLTAPRDFLLEDGSKRPVASMRYQRPQSLSYLANDQVTLASLPYKGDRLAMAVLLPKAKLADLEKTLAAQPQLFSQWLDAAKPEDLAVQLPKAQYETEYDLIPALQGMGVKDVFDPAKSDLSGMSGAPCATTPGQCIFVGLVRHKAFIGINEKGTEAAAGTIIVGGPTGAYTKPTEFTVNRPFVFVIYDTRTKTILFMGRYVSPGLAFSWLGAMPDKH